MNISALIKEIRYLKVTRILSLCILCSFLIPSFAASEGIIACIDACRIRADQACQKWKLKNPQDTCDTDDLIPGCECQLLWAKKKSDKLYDLYCEVVKGRPTTDLSSETLEYFNRSAQECTKYNSIVRMSNTKVAQEFCIKYRKLEHIRGVPDICLCFAYKVKDRADLVVKFQEYLLLERSLKQNHISEIEKSFASCLDETGGIPW